MGGGVFVLQGGTALREFVLVKGGRVAKRTV